ncbi:hypothetical protein GCM10017586_14200 [Microbacterium imperiale]|uniref:Integrase n=1 Tax=Microbacterium imperiale TaxID=33884 RepID=A0A9W6M2Q0_9MICO|nr:hypothetical protein GCM10017544_03510 [Microbacterium imperiale]GLJ79738.1 hypothetical protein GCM10017586_14200 [Microbacterium imperiale]
MVRDELGIDAAQEQLGHEDKKTTEALRRRGTPRSGKRLDPIETLYVGLV